MKRVLLLGALLATAVLLLTSCGSSQECPAYSQVPAVESVASGVA